MKEFNEPKKPAHPKGWQKHEVGTITVAGDFLLAKGEAVDDGTTGIRLLEIHGGYCGFHEPKYPEMKLRFFRVSDQSVICEDVFRVGSSRLASSPACGQNIKWGFIGVSGINAKDNWVAFNLS